MFVVESSQPNHASIITGLALLDGFVYAVGGWEGTSRLDSVERYNSETNTWHSIPSLRMAVTSPAVVTHEGKQVVTEFLTIYSELIYWKL